MGQRLLLFLLWMVTTTSVKSGLSGSCSRPLGLMSGAIQDWQISTSSALSPTQHPGCHMRFARIDQPKGRAWCAGRRAAFEWLQTDLGVSSKITGLMTQGKGDGEEWVISYLVSHSTDAFNWKYCTDSYGTRKVFKGNNDSHTVKHCYLEHPVMARFLRIYILEWHKYPSMRLEIIGCQACNELISLQPSATFTASTWRPWHKQGTCTPDDGQFYGHGGWCAKKNDANQWIQIDLGPPTGVTGIVTKGRGDTNRKQWVTSYSVSYSNDSVLWYVYKDDNYLDPKVFGGNMDKDTERRHYLNQPFVARYVRLHPTAWKGRMSMRVGILGCIHKGDCGPGFLRIHDDSSCVENMAYKKETWVNDKRHKWVGWQYGHSSFAVDGDENNILQRCSILDNYYVDYPLWMVDLGSPKVIHGVVVTTWQGKGQDKTTLYRDYLFNLDRLTVFVDDLPQLENVSSSRKCATISRLNNALFRSLLHFECPDFVEGRYIYIKAVGLSNKWSRLFTAVLCEVKVY